MSVICSICTAQKSLYSYYCCICKLHWCKNCNEYGQSIKTMSNADAFCSPVCTYNWINNMNKISVNYVIEHSLENVSYLSALKKVQENYVEMYWSNKAVKICNEILIGDVCRVIREYLN